MKQGKKTTKNLGWGTDIDTCENLAWLARERQKARESRQADASGTLRVNFTYSTIVIRFHWRRLLEQSYNSLHFFPYPPPSSTTKGKTGTTDRFWKTEGGAATLGQFTRSCLKVMKVVPVMETIE